MKAFHPAPGSLILCLALGLVAIVPSDTVAAGGKPDASASAANQVPLTIAVPESVFVLTNGPVKDPFFPQTTRHVFPVITQTNLPPPSISASEFSIRAFSGRPGEEVVLINNCNLTTGEHGFVTTAVRKIGIKVVSIKTNPVMVEILPDGQSETINLFLPKDQR